MKETEPFEIVEKWTMPITAKVFETVYRVRGQYWVKVGEDKIK